MKSEFVMKSPVRPWQPQWFLDPVTRLPNRTLFASRLQTALNRRQPLVRRYRAKVVVVAVDVYEYTFLRDRYGRVAAKALLRKLADRLEKAVGPGDTVARFWGASFAVLRESASPHPTTEAMAGRIREALSDELRLYRNGAIGDPGGSDELAAIRLSPRLAIVSCPSGTGIPGEEVLRLAQYGLEMQVYDRPGASAGEPDAAFFSVELLEPAFIDIANT